MTQLSRRLEQIVRKELSKTIIPVKTDKGILVGDVLISSDGSYKNIWLGNQLVYETVYLNSVAVKIANILAFTKTSITADNLYRVDQEYGRWFTDSQMLRAQYQKAISNCNYDRSDILWARYIESRDRTAEAKKRAESLAQL